MRFLLISLLLFQVAFAAIEDSIIPLVERFENVENLNSKKYSTCQFQEIKRALCQEGRIRVATYNMLFNLYDHNLQEEYKWKQRMPRILEVLEEMKPDILGVQELYPLQRKEILPHLAKTFAYYGKESPEGEQNGIFYNKERFTLIEGKVFEMGSSSTLTMVHLMDRESGKEIALFNTHFAFANVNKREAQARFAAAVMAPYAHTMATLFMGDLNTFAQRLDLELMPAYDGDYIHQILKRGCLEDAREVSLLGHLGPISTFTNAHTDGKAFTGTGTPGIFLDREYVSKHIQVLLHFVQPAKVNGYFPSDHMPLVTDILLL